MDQRYIQFWSKRRKSLYGYEAKGRWRRRRRNEGTSASAAIDRTWVSMSGERERPFAPSPSPPTLLFSFPFWSTDFSSVSSSNLYCQRIQQEGLGRDGRRPLGTPLPTHSIPYRPSYNGGGIGTKIPLLSFSFSLFSFFSFLSSPTGVRTHAQSRIDPFPPSVG